MDDNNNLNIPTNPVPMSETRGLPVPTPSNPNGKEK